MTRQYQRVAIIGIDWATEPEKVGLAFAEVSRGRCWLRKVKRGETREQILLLIRRELKGNAPVLLAIDAPLGWPVSLGDVLSSHRAGKELRIGKSRLGELCVEEIREEADKFFRRRTDRELETRPLEVGASWIARTAHSALRLLAELRRPTVQSLPLAWKPGFLGESRVIEVYPVATMNAYGILKYKKKKRETKTLLAEALGKPAIRSRNEWNEHELDAVICVLAGFDFIRKNVVEPKNWRAAKREGFIWVTNLRL